jgi:hypothetical protein
MLSLEDLKPEVGTFKLSIMGDKEYHLRKFNLEDEIWLKKTFGLNIEQAFADKESVCAIAWHQLQQEDRVDFKKQKVKIVNDEGDELTIEKGGLALFSSLVVGQLEQVEITKALLQTIGISRQKMEELEAEAEKKRLSHLSPPTGP